MHEARARLALGLLGVFLAIALGEMATRLLGGGEATLVRQMFSVFDPAAGKRCQPDADMRFVLPGSFDARVRCNSQGLRDREHSFAKSAGTRRILVLGDSFAWGFGVENDEMFSTRLERELSNSETINFGVTGYNAVQELARLESDGLAYDPDWLVVLFCDNDLGGNFDDKDGGRPRVELRGDGALHLVPGPAQEPVYAPLARWFQNHSRLVVETYYRTKLLGERLREWRTASRLVEQDPTDAPAEDVAPGSNPAPQEPGSLRNEDMELSLVDPFVASEPRVEQAWTSLGQVYARMRDRIAQHGGHMLVAYVVDPTRTMPEVFQALVAQTGVPPDRVDWQRPDARFAELCADLAIPCVDLAPAFRASTDPEALFLRNNGHWSAAGHEVAARIVAARLRELDASLR
jgi:lysophospholipase L1-like esterase